MSTQHPDNVAVPFFAPSPTMGGDEEVTEAFYAYSHLGCDEQMWDAEGKEVDSFVVEKLFSAHPEFFRAHPLGEDVFLTPRIPNPAVEPAQAKILLEVLYSLPRHSDIARLFHKKERSPIFEVILPMTTAAAELERIRGYYERFVAGMGKVRVLAGDAPLEASFGPFRPETIAVIPLLEERERLETADVIVGEYLRGKKLPHQRVFIARSDPALNYGLIAAVLLAVGALERLERLERDSGVAIYPILGAGGAPFRGNLRPPNVARVVATYPSVQTFTVQSAFKYDYPASEVTAAIASLRATPRASAIPVIDDPRTGAILDRAIDGYRASVATLAPLVRTLAQHVPRRRRRRLHVGLFGYSRSSQGVSLPRAIPFCAALYSIGVPPEILGLAALRGDERRWLSERLPGFDDDLRDAVRYLDAEAVSDVPAPVQADIRAALDLVGERDRAHVETTREIRRQLEGSADGLDELVVRAAALRHFLG